MERGFFSQNGSGRGRGIKEKQHGSANDTTQVTVVMPSAEDGLVLSSSGGHTVEKVTESGNKKGTQDENVGQTPISSTVDLNLVRNGTDVVVPLESIRAINGRFVNTTYGFFLGKRVAYLVFSSMDGLDSMLESGPWFIRLLILLKAIKQIIICKSQSEHIDEFYKLVGDLTAIDAAISDEDQTLLLITSFPSSYDNFVDTLLYGRDTLKLEDVLATLNSKELQKMIEAKGDGGEGLYNNKKSQGFVRNEDQVSSSRADEYDNVDVMMDMSVNELLDSIMDSGGSYHMTYKRDYLVDFGEYDGDNILLGDGRECRVRETGKAKLDIADTLEKEGFTMKMQSDKIKVIKDSLVVLSGKRKDNYVYTLDGQAVTKKTLKGRKQLGEYQIGGRSRRSGLSKGLFGWLASIKKGMLEPVKLKCIFPGYRKGTGSVHVLQGVKFEVAPQEDHSFKVEPHRNVDHVAGLQEVAFAVTTVDKIYEHDSLNFSNTVACKVISKWRTGLKDDMDARSDVYVLSNGCRKCSDDNDSYYWEYTPAKGNVLGMEIVRDQSGNTLRVSQSRFYNGKLVQTLLEGHSILSLEGSLSGDCDVEKNGKWSCIYAVGSQEYQMVCTRLDIASADVGTLDKFDRGLQTDLRSYDAAHDGFVTTEAAYMTLTEAAKEGTLVFISTRTNPPPSITQLAAILCSLMILGSLKKSKKRSPKELKSRSEETRRTKAFQPKTTHTTPLFIIIAQTQDSLDVDQNHQRRGKIDFEQQENEVVRNYNESKKENESHPQDKYVADILKNFDFTTMKAASTPIETNKALNKDEKAEDVDVHLYRLMIRSLMYLTTFRLDIMFAVCACTRFQVTPNSSHLHAVKRIFKYLKGHPKLGLWYPRDSPFNLEAFSDNDYAGSSLDKKSTTREYVAAANCCGQVLWIHNQMLDYGFNFMNTKIHIDNESIICIVNNLVFHSKTKHIEMRHHFIRDSYEKKLIQVIKIHTDHNVVDLLTKAFNVSMFNFLIASIGLLNL
ncbi:hypothetical protein Tco_0360229 [Tanacetum coccineum]